MILKIRPYINKKIMLTLYYSLIYPHLIYANEVWGNTFENQINRIVVLQKRIVRIICNEDRRLDNYALPDSNPLFRNLKILKVKDIFKSKILDFIFNCLTNQISNFSNWFYFLQDVQNRITRANANKNLYIPHIRTVRYGGKSLKVTGPKIWNELPLHIKDSKSYYSFKNKVKNYLLQ